jgi:diguanylate cyclase (GGDEF)-like protein/PAS domain S-box-containing protein
VTRIREGPGPITRSFGAFIVPVLILAMLGLLLLFEGRSDSATERYADIVAAEISVNHLHATLLEQLARGGIDDITGDADRLAATQAEATASIEALPAPATKLAFARYLELVAEVTALRRLGVHAVAVDVGAFQLVPAFGVLQRELNSSRTPLAVSAASARRWRVNGSIVTLLLGGLCLALVTRGAGRTRRQLAAAEAHEGAIRQSTQRFESLMSESSDLVTVLDRGGRVTFQSDSIALMLGWKVDDVVGRDFVEFLADDDVETVRTVLKQAEIRPELRRAIDFQMRRSNGTMVRVEAVVVGRFQDPDILGCLLNIRDQTERLVLEEALRHQAFHDPLTGLPNRALFDDRLAHAYERTERGGHSLCLLLADLDDFKDVNDTYGHALGDTVLIEVAARLRRAVRLEDTIARLGGDEFAILIEQMNGAEDGTRAAERIIEALAKPVVVGDVEVFPHASIGIAMGSAADGSSRTIEELTGQMLIDADLAMYEAKRQGRRGFQFYASSMEAGIKERMAMRSDLERGLGRREFLLHYQPIVSIETGIVVGAEALVRWDHPERGLVPPMAFMPLAEQTGLIVDIGRWVLADACREAAGWDLETTEGTAPYVSVNVSGSQLQAKGFVQEVRDVLTATGLSPARLVLEVTETALIEDSEGNVLKLEQLRDVGIRLAIDDFGTGYSSLSYLRQFNLDILKIDKSFIDALGHDSKGSALVAAMVAIGTSLSMEVVAEGIEDAGQLQDLRTLHCDLGQGYLFAKPVPAAELAVLLSDGVHSALPVPI